MPGSPFARLSSLAVDLLLSRACLGCGAPGSSLCRPCSEPLLGDPERVAVGSGRSGLPPVWAATRYEGVVRSALVAHKERGALELTGPLGTALAAAVRAALAAGPAMAPRGSGVPPCAPVILVPVPSRRAAVRARGDDTVARLARRAARELSASGVASRCLPMLTHRREVADSRGLRARERLTNVSGAMHVRPRLGRRWPGSGGGAVVVVDDLVTTGASLGEAVRALRAAGVPVRTAAVVARR